MQEFVTCEHCEVSGPKMQRNEQTNKSDHTRASYLTDLKARTKLFGGPHSPHDPDGKASADRCLSLVAPNAAPAGSLSSPSGPSPESPGAATSAAHSRPPSESVAIRPPAGERAGPELAQPRGRAPGTGVWRSRGPRSRGERGGHPDILPATYRGRPCLSSSGHWATREALTASAAGPKPRGPRRWRRRWKRNSAPGLRLPPDLPRPRAPRPGASPAARSSRAELPARLPRELPPRESWPGRPRKSPPTAPKTRPLSPRARPLPRERPMGTQRGKPGGVAKRPKPRPLSGRDLRGAARLGFG